MILSFSLSMPNVSSWNGKWSGEGKKYVIIKTFQAKKDIIKAEALAKEGYFHYSWPDGWRAGITVKQVTSTEARKLRKESQGFCGYNWMVDTILMYGKPMADHEIKQFLQKVNKHETVIDSRMYGLSMLLDMAQKRDPKIKLGTADDVLLDLGRI